MRLFVAIELPDAVRKALGDLSSRLKDDAGLTGRSWVRAENLHLTLKFFGEVPETTLPAICESLNRVRLDGAIRLKAEWRGGHGCRPLAAIRVRWHTGRTKKLGTNRPVGTSLGTRFPVREEPPKPP
jgi:2'-5' RNA ligase